MTPTLTTTVIGKSLEGQNYICHIAILNCSRYLTPSEQEERGPQGLVSANMMTQYSEPIEEIIFNDELFGKLNDH